jgi:hypothetical protein
MNKPSYEKSRELLDKAKYAVEALDDYWQGAAAYWAGRAELAEDALEALEEKLANTEHRYAELVETVSRRTSQAAINAAKEALQ